MTGPVPSIQLTTPPPSASSPTCGSVASWSASLSGTGGDHDPPGDRVAAWTTLCPPTVWLQTATLTPEVDEVARSTSPRSPGVAMSTGADQVPPTGCVEALIESSVSPSSTHAAVALPAASTATSTSRDVSLSSSVTIGDVHVGAAPAGTAASEPGQRITRPQHREARTGSPLSRPRRLDSMLMPRESMRRTGRTTWAGPTIWSSGASIVSLSDRGDAGADGVLRGHGDLVGARAAASCSRPSRSA